VATDALGLVARARVVFTVDGGAEQSKEAAASARTEVALPVARRIDARVAALDSHGNRLVEIGSKEVPIVIVGEPPATSEPIAKLPAPPPPVPVRTSPEAPRPPIYARWWPYATAAVAFGGATAYFALATRSDAHDLGRLNADSASHTSAEYAALARPIQDRGRRDALLTNVGLGVTAAFAVAGGALFVMSPRTTERRVVAVPLQGGGAIVWGGAL
jgi:hypothetical protein